MQNRKRKIIKNARETLYDICILFSCFLSVLLLPVILMFEIPRKKEEVAMDAARAKIFSFSYSRQEEEISKIYNAFYKKMENALLI